MSDEALLEEYRYVARKMQIRYPSSVMGYMLLFMYGTDHMLEARITAMKKLDETCKYES